MEYFGFGLGLEFYGHVLGIKQRGLEILVMFTSLPVCVCACVCVCSATGGYPVLKFRHTEWTNTSVLSLIELDHLVHESVLVGEVLVFVRSEQRINHRHVVALHRFDQRRSTVRHRLVQLRTFLHHTKNIRRNKQMLAQL